MPGTVTRTAMVVALASTLVVLLALASPAQAEGPPHPQAVLDSFNYPSGTLMQCGTDNSADARYRCQANGWPSGGYGMGDRSVLDPAQAYFPLDRHWLAPVASKTAGPEFRLVATDKGTLGINTGQVAYASEPRLSGGYVSAGMYQYPASGSPGANGWLHYRLSGNGLPEGARGNVNLTITDVVQSTSVSLEWGRRGPIVVGSCSASPEPALANTNVWPPDPSLLIGLSLEVSPTMPTGMVTAQPLRDADGCVFLPVGKTSARSTEVSLRLHRNNLVQPYVDVFAMPGWDSAGIRIISMLMLDVRVNGSAVVRNLPFGQQYWTVLEMAPRDVPSALVTNAAGFEFLAARPEFRPGDQPLTRGIETENIEYLDPYAPRRGSYQVVKMRSRAYPNHPARTFTALKYIGPTVSLFDAKSQWYAPSGTLMKDTYLAREVGVLYTFPR